MAARGRFARLCVEVDITKPLLAKFKLRNRIRTIEYEGLHLVCFGCGTYRHWQESCPRKPTRAAEEEEGPAVIGGRMDKGDRPENCRDPTVEECLDDRAQIRKEIVVDSGLSDSHGPWMLAKKLEKRPYKGRSARGSGRNVQGKKSELIETDRIRGEPGKEARISSRFNVLYGLEDIYEERPTTIKEGLGDQGPSEAQVGDNKVSINDEVNGKAHQEKLTIRGSQSNTRNRVDEQGWEVHGRSGIGTGTQNVHRRKEATPRGGSRQAAAEEEHTVVRGMDRGRNIVTMMVANEQDFTMGTIEDDSNVAEHHQDPPDYGGQEDHMVIEQELVDGGASHLRCLEPGEGSAWQQRSS